MLEHDLAYMFDLGMSSARHAFEKDAALRHVLMQAGGELAEAVARPVAAASFQKMPRRTSLRESLEGYAKAWAKPKPRNLPQLGRNDVRHGAYGLETPFMMTSQGVKRKTRPIEERDFLEKRIKELYPGATRDQIQRVPQSVVDEAWDADAYAAWQSQRSQPSAYTQQLAQRKDTLRAALSAPSQVERNIQRASPPAPNFLPRHVSVPSQPARPRPPSRQLAPVPPASGGVKVGQLKLGGITGAPRRYVETAVDRIEQEVSGGIGDYGKHLGENMLGYGALVGTPLAAYGYATAYSKDPTDRFKRIIGLPYEGPTRAEKLENAAIMGGTGFLSAAALAAPRRALGFLPNPVTFFARDVASIAQPSRVGVFDDVGERALELGERARDYVRNKSAAADGKRYRNRVALLIHNDKGEVLVSQSGNKYNFPGGGTENGKVNDAAEREALEEVGWEVDEVKSLGVDPVEFTWHDAFKATQAAKGRDHDGWRNYFRYAKAKKRNKKLYGKEGDGMKNLKFVSIDKLLVHYKKSAAKKGNSWKVMDRANVKALAALKKTLDAEGGKP